eukprot:gene11385-13237_t
MDIGVGTFIVSSALTSKFARTEESKSVAATVRLRKLFTFQKLVVLLLGFGRFVLLKAVNYHEHVSEYGIHWNFFMTLYFIWTTADLAHALVPRWLILWLAIILLAVYQIPVSALSADPVRKCKDSDDEGWFASSRLVQDTSRRLANTPYVCLVIALALTTILMLYLADTLSGSGQAAPSNGNTVLTLHYMNKHSLMVFLVANVVTGGVNMSMQTIHVYPEIAFAIMCVYTTAITCVAWGLEYVSNWYGKPIPKPTKQ